MVRTVQMGLPFLVGVNTSETRRRVEDANSMRNCDPKFYTTSIFKLVESSDVDILKKSISIRYDIFENFIDTWIFLKCPYLGNLSIVTSMWTKKEQKIANLVEGECRRSVNKWQKCNYVGIVLFRWMSDHGECWHFKQKFQGTKFLLKKLGRCMSLSTPGVELEGSNDLPFLKYYNTGEWVGSLLNWRCQKYWLYWKILQTNVAHH